MDYLTLFLVLGIAVVLLQLPVRYSRQARFAAFFVYMFYLLPVITFLSLSWVYSESRVWPVLEVRRSGGLIISAGSSGSRSANSPGRTRSTPLENARPCSSSIIAASPTSSYTIASQITKPASSRGTHSLLEL